ncbi:MAG TPA: NAD(P)/FAD-dependent oxidoreductase [Actinomycetota bacterium]|nr:NAD(P)/FAD-dependent oxidoreductase [Actinomycetota bacterium]
MARSLDAVVVGGGHNGLVAAAYLAKAGRSVVVLEARPMVGGAAVTEEVWPGYRVSTASYVVSLLLPQIVQDLALDRHGYRVYPIDPAYFAPFPDGRGLVVWEEPEKAAEEIARFSPRDAEAYVRYEHDLDELARFVRPLLTRIPPTARMRGMSDMRAALSLGRYLRAERELLPRVIDLMTMSVADFLGEYFTDPAVLGALAPGGVIGAWGGPMSPGSAYVLLHHRMGAAAGGGGAWAFVRGGMGALSEAIASAARAAGAEIRTQARVSRIARNGSRATGVVLEDGTEVSARMVLSAIHPRTTFLEMIGAEHLPDGLVSELHRYRTRGASAKVHLALSELPDFRAMPGKELGVQHPEFIISPSLDYLERAWDDAKYGRVSEHPMLDCVIPTTKDPTLAPEGRHILSAFVQYAPRDLAEGSWTEEREALADRVIQTIGEYAPNVPGAVLERHVVTPEDLEQRFGLLGGNIFQGEMSLDQLFFLRPVRQAGAYRTPIRGLYLCGSGTHPGGGVMGAPGYNAARIVARDLRRRR